MDQDMRAFRRLCKFYDKHQIVLLVGLLLAALGIGKALVFFELVEPMRG